VSGVRTNRFVMRVLAASSIAEVGWQGRAI
jgi:hypothetical protein